MSWTDHGPVALIGGGPLARALARLFETSGRPTRICPVADTQEGLQIEAQAEFTTSVADAAQDAAMVFIAVAADALQTVVDRLGDVATPDQIVLNACRGVGDGFLLPHRMIRESTCLRKIGILGGPIHVREVEEGRRLNAVVASRFEEAIEAVRVLVAQLPISIHPSRDVVGVEVAGVVSNVASIAAGIAEGLEVGATARGVVLTHGLAEARRLGTALGAEPRTYSGLAGVGELIPRDILSMDRHVALGRELARGRPLADAHREVGEAHIEGIKSAHEATRLARELGLHLPLISGVSRVLEGSVPPPEALQTILTERLDLGPAA